MSSLQAVVSKLFEMFLPKRNIRIKRRSSRFLSSSQRCIIGCGFFIILCLLFLSGLLLPEPVSTQLFASHNAKQQLSQQSNVANILVSNGSTMNVSITQSQTAFSAAHLRQPRIKISAAQSQQSIFNPVSANSDNSGDDNVNGTVTALKPYSNLIPVDSLSIDSIIWDFGACGCTGWGIETVNILIGMIRVTPNIKVITSPQCWCGGYSNDTVAMLDHLQSHNHWQNWPMNATFFISHKPPGRYPKFPYYGLITITERPQFVIGRSMTEVNSIPSWHVARINGDDPSMPNRGDSNQWVDEIWAPSNFVKNVYISNGVSADKIKVIGEPFNPQIYNNKVSLYPPLIGGDDNTYGIDENTTVFLSVFKWEPRKGYDSLLRAFVQEFGLNDNVRLVIQTYLYTHSIDARDIGEVTMALHSELQSIANEISQSSSPSLSHITAEYVLSDDFLSKIIVMTDELSMTELASLYKSVACLVQSSHGEGFGLPVLEAMAVGTPVMVTNWSGLTDLVTEHRKYGLLIATDGLEYARNADGKTDFDTTTEQWAKIDIDSLRSNMRWIVDNRDEAIEMGKRGRSYVWKHFHPKVITKAIETRMKELLYLRQIQNVIQK